MSQDFREDLKAFIDDELDPGRAAEVQAAIDRDPGLRRDYEVMKLISQEVQESARQPEPKGLEETLDKVARPRRPSWMRWAAVGSCAVGAVLVSALLIPTYQAKSSARSTAPAMERAELDRSKASADAPAGALASRPEEAKASRSKIGFAEPAPAYPDTVIEPNRLVVRTADLTVQVEDARACLAKATKLAGALSGWVEDSSVIDFDGKPQSSLRMRIPQTKFDSAVDALRGMGYVQAETMSGEDVTNQVIDSDVRARVLAEEEQQYITLLRSTKNPDQLIRIRTRLSQIRQERDSLKAQSKSLRGLSAMSTINARFVQDGKPIGRRPGPDDWFQNTWDDATGTLGLFGRGAGQFLTYALVLSPVWIPFGLLGWHLWRKIGR
ncbi:MAG: DUF4349 domain-containing protein [Fimbriimonadaceae bacterium]|nr:DUF4349 domain-containing protein [Fimbriimonadaceae bacterium]QYK55327.1 MAG: DUF4349 domain-containing protein [Fimbriimonadaceae bacterium]